MACRPDLLRGGRSLRDLYTPSVGAPVGRDQDLRSDHREDRAKPVYIPRSGDGPRRASLAAVVGGGFGMDEEAADLGGLEFKSAFEGGDDLVDLGHGEVVGEGAVAVDLMRSAPLLWARVTKTSWMSRI